MAQVENRYLLILAKNRAYVASLVFRQKESLKNSVEAFQNEKKAHIELYEKQQKVKFYRNIVKYLI